MAVVMVIRRRSITALGWFYVGHSYSYWKINHVKTWACTDDRHIIKRSSHRDRWCHDDRPSPLTLSKICIESPYPYIFHVLWQKTPVISASSCTPRDTVLIEWGTWVARRGPCPTSVFKYLINHAGTRSFKCVSSHYLLCYLCFSTFFNTAYIIICADDCQTKAWHLFQQECQLPSSKIHYTSTPSFFSLSIHFNT